MKKMFIVLCLFFTSLSSAHISSFYQEHNATKDFKTKIRQKWPELNDLELKRKVIELVCEVNDRSKIETDKQLVVNYHILNFGLAPEGFLFDKHQTAKLNPNEKKIHGDRLFLRALNYILSSRTVICDESDTYDEQRVPEIPKEAFEWLDDEEYLTWKEVQNEKADLYSVAGQKALIEKIYVTYNELLLNRDLVRRAYYRQKYEDYISVNEMEEIEEGINKKLLQGSSKWLILNKKTKEMIFAYNALRDIHNEYRIYSIPKISDSWIKSIQPTKTQEFTDLLCRYQAIPVGLGILSGILLYLNLKKAAPPGIVHAPAPPPQYIAIPVQIVYNRIIQLTTLITTYRIAQNQNA